MTGLLRLLGPQWLRTHLIAIGMAVFLSLIGALGSDTFSLPMRLGFWLILMSGGTAIAQVVGLQIDRMTNLSVWQDVLLMMALIVPPITLLVWLVSALFTGVKPNPGTLPHYVLPVAIVSLAMALLHVTVNLRPAQSHAFSSPQTAAAEPGSGLRARLPFKFKAADIYALSGEDHYLRVHTSAGETLILMRLYDAISLLDGIEGSQVHRSWWVARDAVADVRRNDGRVSLVVKGGVTAPVSRSFHKALKDGGWF